METSTCVDSGAVLGLRKRRPSSEKAVLAMLKEEHPTLQSGGFARAIARLFEKEDYAIIAGRFNPDAFVIHEDEMTLDIIEVVDTNPISLYKGQHIGILADALIEEDWKVRVAVFNPLGDCVSELPGICYHQGYQNEDLSIRDATISAEAAMRRFQDYDASAKVDGQGKRRDLSKEWLEMFQKIASSPGPDD